jgi:hypothetical protein
MTADDEVLDHARADGFDLEERGSQDAWVWGSVPRRRSSLALYLEPRQASNWMADRLRRERVFI